MVDKSVGDSKTAETSLATTKMFLLAALMKPSCTALSMKAIEMIKETENIQEYDGFRVNSKLRPRNYF